MIVQCEQCSKQYRLNPNLIKGTAAKVRCSNCQYVFQVSRPKEVDVVETALTSRGMEGAPPASRPSRTRLLILLIPLLVIAAGIALWLFVPWPLKSKSVEKTTGIEQLHLVETRGYFVENQRAGQLFVIQGRVRNEFPKPRRWIHLRAKIYTSDGKAARQLDFFAGNILSNQQLQTMPLEELLGFVQSQPTTKEQGRIIAAQEEISFTVPFGDLPELTELSDYSVEILASQPA